MATRAKALRQFAKKYFNLDLVGMSETAVLKDLLKKEYNIDAVGNSVVSVLMNAAGDDGGGEAVDLVTLTPQAEPNVYITVEDVCAIFASPAQLLASVTLGGETLEVANSIPSDFYTTCANGDFDWRMTIDGTTSPWMSENEPIGGTITNWNAHIDYTYGQYNEGDTVSVTVDVKYKGETGKITIPNVPIHMD